jgi:hypothetical protein
MNSVSSIVTKIAFVNNCWHYHVTALVKTQVLVHRNIDL